MMLAALNKTQIMNVFLLFTALCVVATAECITKMDDQILVFVTCKPTETYEITVQYDDNCMSVMELHESAVIFKGGRT
jgi:hypothetical protein